MPRERSDQRARIGVPDTNRVVPAAGKMGAVRRIRHGRDRTRMPNERSFQRGRIDDDGIDFGGSVVPGGVGGDAHRNGSVACRLNGRRVGSAGAGELRYGAVCYVDVRRLEACDRFAECDRHIKRARDAAGWTGNRRRNRRARPFKKLFDVVPHIRDAVAVFCAQYSHGIDARNFGSSVNEGRRPREARAALRIVDNILIVRPQDFAMQVLVVGASADEDSGALCGRRASVDLVEADHIANVSVHLGVAGVSGFMNPPERDVCPPPPP